MGEIADAYIWAEMNGVDLDNNPEGWAEYYHDKECDEYEEEIIDLKKKIKKLKKIIKKQKELLKECHDIIYETAFKLRKVSDIDKCNEIRKKIRDVLGAEYGFETPKYYVRERLKDTGE